MLLMLMLFLPMKLIKAMIVISSRKHIILLLHLPWGGRIEFNTHTIWSLYFRWCVFFFVCSRTAETLIRARSIVVRGCGAAHELATHKCSTMKNHLLLYRIYSNWGMEESICCISDAVVRWFRRHRRQRQKQKNRINTLALSAFCRSSK